jgi:hypothetical protein|tara:strand:- start:192 stop:458 length:267 start_codon:yes stop_codon:yes gene_type:complete
MESKRQLNIGVIKTMSQIKEQLIGYENNDWITAEDHVKVDEVTEYLMYAMSVSEMQQAAKQHIQHDLYTMARSDFQKVYYDTIGVHKK